MVKEIVSLYPESDTENINTAHCPKQAAHLS
jgi:hypothetical protein